MKWMIELSLKLKSLMIGLLTLAVFAPATLHAGEKKPEVMSEKATITMEQIAEKYVNIQLLLAGDQPIEAIQKAAAELSISAAGLKDRAVAKKIKASSDRLKSASSIKAARDQFKKLSEVVLVWYRAQNKGASLFEEVNCSMAHASWLQKKGEVKNPYYGKEMLACGDKVE
jgi:hypothetical protein